jgi:uncharacterized lipoprotein YajG
MERDYDTHEVCMRTSTVIAAVILLSACSTPSSVRPVSVPLKYKVMASPGEFAATPCAGVLNVRVTDSRADKKLGTRFVEGKSGPAAEVTAASDVAEWVQTGAVEALKRAGAMSTKSNAATLNLSVESIVTSENVLHRSGYEGRIVISAELSGSNGASCWKERLEGFSENYGYSGSVENYQETLNHALDRAMIRMLNSAEFKKAICSCGGA